MSDQLPPEARFSPSVARNREPILAALRTRLPKSGSVLEIAAGTGEHAAFNAAAFPHLEWQPTDADPNALVSIAAWRDHTALPNLHAPLYLDAASPDEWPLERTDVVISINMIHIAPWSAAQGLMVGASRLLPPGGLLFLYGPYLETEVETAPSNLAFHQDLKARNPAWGLRDLGNVVALAVLQGFKLSERLVMPANNLALFFEKA
ncbi:DUF938 domain-containing protein [Acidisoma cellulosilytica]|uniref:DUF938 domain-containing protein n=1 Tax=Acidisoma cellulosilyticum TaxID=2802395 RepID=A0A963Z254_9PROT|nr:DUF938 domain-containing protein [Acidisoma cellulosilyticum]MCB8881467.1 DUF938 domain-containing protein [Acidisoma cellulosilyticum]